MTDLFELPFRQEYRSTRKDALAEMVLASPSVQSALAEVLGSFGSRASDEEFRGSLERVIATYTETRAAAAEITTTMITAAAGAAVLKQITPGAMVLGPALASTIAYEAAVASFPFGKTLGGLWYTLVPRHRASGADARHDGRLNGWKRGAFGIFWHSDGPDAANPGPTSPPSSTAHRCFGAAFQWEHRRLYCSRSLRRPTANPV